MGQFKSGSRGGFGDRRAPSRFGGGSRGRGGFGGGDRSGGSRFGGRSGDRGSRGFGGPTEMHDAICDKCGKNCEVPFKPTTGKPVLCSDCFRQSDRPARGFSRDQGRPFPSQSAPSAASPEQFNQINAKLDKIIGILQELEMADEEDSEDDDVEEEKAE